MRVQLLYPEGAPVTPSMLVPFPETLGADLDLETLLGVMARDDAAIHDVASETLRRGCTDPDIILYRQRVLRDALANGTAIRELYSLASAAIRAEHREWVPLSRSPQLSVSRSIRVLDGFLGTLGTLRSLAERYASEFRSEGFQHLFAMTRDQLEEPYLQRLRGLLAQLRFPRGVWMSASLGPGLRGSGHSLREPPLPRKGWTSRLLGRRRSPDTIVVAERDESGHRFLSELIDRGIDPVAQVLAQSVDHVSDFLTSLQRELGFLLGAIHLSEELARRRAPTCFPVPGPLGPLHRSIRGLYDPSLALQLERPAVPNSLEASESRLFLITGANQGGKTTFLRSVGLAQLLMQAGLFVPAERFAANLVPSLFSHFPRAEDPSLRRGKLEEELLRLGAIARALRPGSLVLLNESLASTNEREGSEIARQITRAWLEVGAEVFFVTFLYDFAEGVAREGRADARFLRAERLPNGARTFRVVEGRPLSTAFGDDVYREVFEVKAPVHLHPCSGRDSEGAEDRSGTDSRGTSPD